jgi:DNA-binding winged helix-turn-helix (wHTH) protein/tetratricopeptide (TPR) repeat protein
MSLMEKEIYGFGPFLLDPRERILSCDGTIVSLTPKAFETLLCLVRNQGRVLTKDELLKQIWPDTFVEEVNLAVNISAIRKALGENPQDCRFIATVPGRGYRFIADVRTVVNQAENHEKALTQNHPEPVEAATGPENHEIVAPDDSPEKDTESQKSTVVLKTKPVATSRRTLWIGGAVVVIVAAVVSGYFFFHRPTKLTEKDTIVLADFSNSTGDAVFDDTLKTALTVGLDQSPFLNVLSDNKVAATLKLMTRPVNTKLTPDVARELCMRADSKAYIAGSIAILGNEYVIGLKAVNCQSGEPLAQQQVTANGKEKVLNAVGEAAAKLRAQLGESLPSVRKLDVPLDEATTSSLEALQAYSLGLKAFRENYAAAALPWDQRAIELDPKFAIGYEDVGVDYLALGEEVRAREYYTKAFELREHAGGREKLAISADYYRVVTGEREKAAQTYQEWIANYPRDYRAYLRLGTAYAEQGQYEKGAQITRESLRLAPDSAGANANLTNCLLALQRFDEARRMLQQVKARKLDNLVIHDALYALAFIGNDHSAMAEQQRWFAGKPEENTGFLLASDTEAYAGHLSNAQEFTKRSADSAIRADRKENGAIALENSALREAAFGNLNRAKQEAAEGLNLMPSSQGVSVEAALAYAMGGDSARAESLAQDLNKRYPVDTQTQTLWLPAIRAQLALNRKNPADALKSLQAASVIEFGQILFVANLSCLYPTYNRGEAYLAAGQGKEAAVEFQKILDHSGLVWNCWTGALAHLGVARANALQSRTSQGADADAARVRALAAYKDFLALWKDADTDIPILKQAKAEYAKLH